MAHDPLCSPDSLYGNDPEDEFCHCELVALVRADERARAEAGWPRCSTCDGGGCPDCTDPA
jgi:hypothetical protein